jgi:hypothetical protein
MSQYDIGEVADNFNKNIKKLILILNQSLENNILFDTIKRRTSLIIKSHPLFLLEEAGPQIFQYRDYIKSESEELFLNLEDTVLNHDQMQDYIKDNQNDKDSIILLLKLIKDIWIKYDNKEKKIIQKVLKVLLSEYCKFLTTKN